MKAVIQRVSMARVRIGGQTAGEIAGGLVILLGIAKSDTREDAQWLLNKIVDLRIFEDRAGKMNLSIGEVRGELLIISQFTLYGDCRKGRRPSFDRAARPESAEPLYDYFVELARATGLKVQTGIFQATMQVELVNEGPVTLVCESVKIATE